MTASKIEWTDRSDWNPLRGCTRVSPGCGGPGPQGGCYAEAIAARFSAPGQPFHGFAERTPSGPRWTGQVAVQWDRLDLPLRWRKPARVFASSTSDLFHERLAIDEIASIYAVAVAAVHLRGHTIQILTKRADRMRQVLTDEDFWHQVNVEAGAHVMERTDPLDRRSDDARATLAEYGPDKPPPGICLGVSVEDQPRADERIPLLLETPAALHWISAEPLLSGLYIEGWLCGPAALQEPGCQWLDWVVVGGESGPGARGMDIRWARSIVAQCSAAGTACFVKQLGAEPFDSDRTASGQSESLCLRDRKGGDMAEWPEDLRVREMPT